MPLGPTVWGTTLTFEASSAPPGATPSWVDISAYLQPAWDAASGRQTEMVLTDPAAFTASLLNDGRFTTGNPGSPYPWWRQARRIRLRETVGYYTFDLFDGFLARPRGTHRIDVTGTASPQDAVVAIAGVDLLGRLANERRFLSVLGEHIRFNGGAFLRGHWPCNDVAPFRDAVSTNNPIAETFGLSASAIAATSGAKAVVTGGGGQIFADDISVCRLDAALGTSGGLAAIAAAPDMRMTSPVNMTVAAGEVATLVGWYFPQLPANKLGAQILSMYSNNVSLVLHTTDTAGTLTLTAGGGFPLTGSITGPVLPDQMWVPFGVQYGFLPSVLELWVGTTRYTGALSGTAPDTDGINGLNVAMAYAGGMGHLQLYRGAVTDWGYTQYLAQVLAAQTGLERQSTGARVNTIADYAGVPASARDVDRGAAVMSVARLAGRTPADVLAEAATTEQGALYARSGVLTFRDRRSVYNL